MISRLTARAKEQEKRQYALNQVIEKQAIKNYQGKRINSKGELFIIQNAWIWTIWNWENQI